MIRSLLHKEIPDVDALARQADDPWLALIGLFRKDERPGKVDLGVGVYRERPDATPIFRAVQGAEKRLLETRTAKAYIGPEGDLVFLDRLWELVGGDMIERSHVAGVQTPAAPAPSAWRADLIARMGGRGIWLAAAELAEPRADLSRRPARYRTYDFFDIPSQSVIFDNLVSALEGPHSATPCCCMQAATTRTGGVLSEAMMESPPWSPSAACCRSSTSPIRASAAGSTRMSRASGIFSASLPEALVAVSCSKSLRLYRERTCAILRGQLFLRRRTGCAQTSRASPAPAIPWPDHGAAVWGHP